MNVQQFRATLTKLRKGFEQNAHPSSADEVCKLRAGLCTKAGQLTYELISTGVIALDGLPEKLRQAPVYEYFDDDDHGEAFAYDDYWEAFVGCLSSTVTPVISTTGYPEAALAVYRPGMDPDEYSWRLDQRGFDYQEIWPALCGTFAQAIDHLICSLSDPEEPIESKAEAQGQERNGRMSKKNASTKARELLESDSSFAEKSVREWAKAIGCSPGLVPKLPAWKAIMEQRKKDKPKGGFAHRNRFRGR